MYVYEQFEDWPNTWERLTTIPPEKRVPFTQEMIEAQIRLSDLTPGRLVPPGETDPLAVFSAAIFHWGFDTVERLRKRCMELLAESNPLVDPYSIERTVRQIEMIVKYMASCGCRELEFEKGRLGIKEDISEDQLRASQKGIWTEINKLTVLWTDEFRDWAEPKRETPCWLTPKVEGYTVAALREATGLKNNALNRRGRDAGVKTPGRGKRTFRYSRADARKILNEIISESSEDELRARCKAALQSI